VSVNSVKREGGDKTDNAKKSVKSIGRANMRFGEGRQCLHAGDVKGNRERRGSANMMCGDGNNAVSR
jgi:hypothetical protein